MKVVVTDRGQYILRFSRGEEVFSEVEKFMQSEGISACVFTGIGATSEVEIGYYNTHLKDYRKKPFYEELELVSFLGNGCLVDNKPFIHAHGMFSRTDFSCLGGHVFKLVISVTCEIFLTKLEGKMERKLDQETNLKLLE
ncbi:MAG: DNA-binding protein [Candidatus Doudnabacteria bacterium]|nr:DNA-binding protein [Candidatus Doudnabacteria bacterium]